MCLSSTRQGQETPPANAAKTIHASVLSPTHLWVDENQKKNPKITPDEYYHQVWKLANDNFLWRERLADWAKWEHKYDGQLKTFADAERAIGEMLDSLKDDYTFFKNAAMTKAEQNDHDETNVVTSRMLPGKIGYIAISTFSSNHTAEETKAHLLKLKLSGAEAYVLDLRENGGGYVREAWGVFALFVDSGKFSTLKGQYEGKPYLEDMSVTKTDLLDIENGTTTKASRDANLTGNKPVIVLVNGDSASASEMLLAALRDNGRVESLGVKTFGKGIAQVTWTLERATSVQITFARFYSPNGVCHHGQGIAPDHIVKSSGVAGDDNQLSEAVKLLEKKITH